MKKMKNPAGNPRKHRGVSSVIFSIFLWLYAVVSLYPLLWMIFYSFKSNEEIFVTNPYGLPLDNRMPYTKSDWLIWTATLADNRDTFEDLVAPLWDAYNTMESRVPMTDWYYTVTGQHKSYISGSEKIEKSFRNRTVVGGHFIKLLEYKGIMKI